MMMRFKLLGKSGLRVSELCLGTMTFGEDWGWGASKEESKTIFTSYLEAGGNFIDTSVNYTNGTSETFLGEFLQPIRDKIVLATKYSLSRDWDDPNAGGNSRKNMVGSIETSLKRLRTDYIDLYYLHMWDYLTPVEEVMRGLDDLVRSGKVLYIGISDTPAYIVARANTIAELRGWSQFLTLQIPYSLSNRDAERDLLPMARDLGLTVCPWGLLGGGVLTGKYTAAKDEPKRFQDPTISERTQRVAAVVQEIAQELQRSTAQVAINWVRQQQHKAPLIPILGARTLDQLADNLSVLDWQLDENQLARLDEAGAIELGFPHNFLPGNKYIFGNTDEQIDRPGRKT
jgi:aryl-alcohol dehydrogenase-like predicted oxidoreductase